MPLCETHEVCVEIFEWCALQIPFFFFKGTNFVGDGEIEGLTDQVQPRKLGPKRASKIRKLFNLTKEDDVRKYVITHKKVKEGMHFTNF